MSNITTADKLADIRSRKIAFPNDFAARLIVVELALSHPDPAVRKEGMYLCDCWPDETIFLLDKHKEYEPELRAIRNDIMSGYVPLGHKPDVSERTVDMRDWYSRREDPPIYFLRMMLITRQLKRCRSGSTSLE